MLFERNYEAILFKIIIHAIRSFSQFIQDSNDDRNNNSFNKDYKEIDWNLHNNVLQMGNYIFQWGFKAIVLYQFQILIL